MLFSRSPFAFFAESLRSLRPLAKGMDSATNPENAQLGFFPVNDPSVYYRHLNIDVVIEYDNVGVFAW